MSHPYRKSIIVKQKATSQNEVNNKIHTSCFDVYRKDFPNFG